MRDDLIAGFLTELREVRAELEQADLYVEALLKRRAEIEKRGNKLAARLCGDEFDTNEKSEIRNSLRAPRKVEEMTHFKWLAEVGVDALWVADGFDLTKERLADLVQNDLEYSLNHEVTTEIIVAPDPAIIRFAQGYYDGKV